MKTIYFNQDNHHFYGSHPAEDMTEEGVDRLVDFYAQGTQLAGLLFCVNVQRALFPSKTWERFWDGYDPEKGENQAHTHQPECVDRDRSCHGTLRQKLCSFGAKGSSIAIKSSRLIPLRI